MIPAPRSPLPSRVPGAYSLALGSLLSLWLASALPVADATDGVAFFETRVRPALARHCSRCHSAKKQKSGLRLDGVEWIRKGGERGPLIVPGSPQDSLLVRAVRYDDEELQMPPKGRLEPEVIGDLVEWIEMGAPMPLDPASGSSAGAESGPDRGRFDLEERREHWAYAPLRADPVPDVSDEAWPFGEVDRFVLAALDAHELSPAPDADRRALLRRVSFDLIGLPPSPEETRAFLEDTSPQAFERVVDRLLASPHFGERWARHWLDLMRYSDTRGHEYDFPLPNAYQYRDYVVRAFNQDVPYDQFVREHIAGDLLAEPRLDPEHGSNESILATGFWFMGDEVHSPVDVRADELDRVAGQIDTVSKAFLGLTVACARCHDHKFDAITTADYYSLAGYPLSGGYRQVRFETLKHNAAIARRLEALRAEHQGNVASAESARLVERFRRAGVYLGAARETLRDTSDPDEPLAIDPRGDVLFADFEGADYGEWLVTGTAFGKAPLAEEDASDYLRPQQPRGRSLVQSHNARSGMSVSAADEHLGTLESPDFRIEHGWIHFLLAGGAHEGRTAFQLLVDGVLAREATGSEHHRLEPAAFDVREFRGRTARLRLVDGHAGGWGNIALDHIVFSESPEAGALELTLSPRETALRSWRAATVAERHGLEPRLVEAWVHALDRGRADESDPLHAFATLVGLDFGEPRVIELVLRGLSSEARRSAPEIEWTVDFGEASAPLLQNGFAFQRRSAGAALLVADAQRAVAEIAPRGGAYYDPTWNILEQHPESEQEPGSVSWPQAGRTLRTPSFTLTHGKLAYLVRGAGHAYASVHSHRLIHGPLHGALIREWPGSAGFRWIEHDLSDYAGARVHVEFSPRADREASALAIVGVAQIEGDAPWADAGHHWLVRRLLADAPRSMRALAESYQAAFDMAASAWDPPAAGPAWLANWMLERPDLGEDVIGSERSTALEFARAARSELAQVRRVSRLAPAMMEGSGVDEHVLLRGSPRSPGALAPRRFLEVFAGLEDASPEAGSGRLQLAERVIANPLAQRVLVNRVWQHLFGRGIVASVDDFGRMGEEPSHPELLDYLARHFASTDMRLKPLIRELVLTRTYRMSSRPVPESDAADPTNRLLHHMPMRRLSAEAIRDAILAVAGTFVPGSPGPSVPLHLTEFMQGRGRPEVSGPLDGAGKRSLYLSVRRNFPMPFFAVFDFPPPAAPVGRRSASNVPAQALALMNDPFVQEQAERWAERTLREAPDDVRRIERAYERALTRPPESWELERALAFLAAQRELHAGDERAAWGDLCHALFNAKEFLFVQ